MRRFLLKAMGMRLRLYILGVLVVLCALARSGWCLVSRMDSETIAAVSRAAGSSTGMQGLTRPGLLDWVAFGIWHVGGFGLLGWARWLSVFCVWAAGLAVVAALLCFVFTRIHGANARRWFPAVCAAGWLGLTLSGAGTTWKWRRESLNNPVFVAPVSLLDSLRAFASGRVYCNAQALPYLLIYCPKLVDGDLSPARLSDLGQNPSAWRQEDRKQRFGGVLLVEPAADTDPLLRHLLLSPDWHLTALSNLGMVFLPGEGPAFQPPPAGNAAPPLNDDRQRAVYLAGMAQQLYTAGFDAASLEYIAEAQRIDGDDSNVLLRAATLYAMERRWNDALDLSKEALDRQPDLVQAKMILARAYLAVGSPGEAYSIAREVADAAPDNVFALFLMARASEGNHNYGAEAQALEGIIAICQSAGQKVGQYRILLAQSYARQGMAQPALAQYHKALDSGEISAGQAKQVRDAIKTIESKMPHETP